MDGPWDTTHLDGIQLPQKELVTFKPRGSITADLEGLSQLAGVTPHRTVLQLDDASTSLSFCNTVPDSASLTIALHVARRNAQITTLRMTNVHLSSAAVEALVAGLDATSISTLQLDFVETERASGSPSPLCRFVSGLGVQQLSLRGNGLNLTDAQCMATLLIHDCALQELNLFGNPLGNDGARVLLNSIRHNRCLRALSLAKCGLDDACLEDVVPAVHRYVLTEAELPARRALEKEAASARKAQFDLARKKAPKGVGVPRPLELEPVELVNGRHVCRGSHILAHLDVSFNSGITIEALLRLRQALHGSALAAIVAAGCRGMPSASSPRHAEQEGEAMPSLVLE